MVCKLKATCDEAVIVTILSSENHPCAGLQQRHQEQANTNHVFYNRYFAFRAGVCLHLPAPAMLQSQHHFLLLSFTMQIIMISAQHMQAVITSKSSPKSALISPAQKHSAGGIRMIPPEQLQLLFWMPILHCGPAVTVLSAPKKHHMGHQEIMGGNIKRRNQMGSKT